MKKRELVLTRSPDLLFRTSDNFITLIVSLETNSFYSLNPIAGLIWLSINGQSSIKDIIKDLQARFADPKIPRDVENFVNTLRKHNLVEAQKSDTAGLESDSDLGLNEALLGQNWIKPEIHAQPDDHERALWIAAGDGGGGGGH